MNDWLVELISTLLPPDQCRIMPWKTLTLALKNERKLIVTCFRMTATFNFAYYLKCSIVTIWNSSDRESAWSNCIKTAWKLCRPICFKKCSLTNHIINVDESDYKPINTMHISPLCQQSLYSIKLFLWQPPHPTRYCWVIVGPASQAVASIGLMYRVGWAQRTSSLYLFLAQIRCSVIASVCEENAEEY